MERGLHPKNLQEPLKIQVLYWCPYTLVCSRSLYVYHFRCRDGRISTIMLNYMGIIFAIILGFTGFGIARLSEEEKRLIQEGV